MLARGLLMDFMAGNILNAEAFISVGGIHKQPVTLVGRYYPEAMLE
jgi:hypothetical protein